MGVHGGQIMKGYGCFDFAIQPSDGRDGNAEFARLTIPISDLQDSILQQATCGSSRYKPATSMKKQVIADSSE
jgi:hypothetical protein